MTAIYVCNRLPTRAITPGSIPFELWYSKKPTYDHLRVWGCVCYAQIPKEKLKKLDRTAVKYMFIGYKETTSQYRLYDSINKRFIISRDVIFEESKSYFTFPAIQDGPCKRFYVPPIEPWEERLI